jgi:NADP-reducing hydrogenase subunit HndB
MRRRSMPKLSLEELRQLRERTRKEMEDSSRSDKITIMVGMGTCGIAAGARETMQTFVEQAEKMGLKNVVIKPTGCMGSCYAEPTVEVNMQGMPNVLYGKVNAEVAKRIMEKHVVGKQLLNNSLYDKPAADILAGNRN